MNLRSQLLPFVLCACYGVAGVHAQDLLPQPDPFAPYQQGTQDQQDTQGKFVEDPVVKAAELTTSNALLYQQYQALQNGTALAASGCQTCGGSGACGGAGCGPCDRCSCTAKNFPWFEGPGNCDNWCVGPHWGIEASGLIIHRENTNLNALIAGAPTSVEDQFDYAPGARLFATAYNCHGWGMQVGYEGMNDWDAAVVFPDSPPAPVSERSIDYMSRLNSVEFNFLPRTPQPWKVFSGVRYVELDEDLQEFTIEEKDIPVPGPPVSEFFVDTGVAHILENHLIGFQLGGLRDGWQVGDWLSFSGFANAGVYHNSLKRDDVDLNITTVITNDNLATPLVNEFSQTTTVTSTTVRREFSEVAFLGEAGASASLKLTPCLALKSGYQVILLDGVGQGIDAFFNPDFDRSTVLYHGLQFGLEYRR